MLARKFGNVTSESVFSFEYGLKPISELLKMEDLDLTSIKKIPFQTQIHYTTKDGSRCLRVITQELDVSHERNELEKKANFDVLSYNAMNKGSQMAKAGDLRKGQAILKTFKRNFQSTADVDVERKQKFSEFNKQMNDVYSNIG